MAKNTSIIGILINIQKAGNGDKAAIGALKSLQKGIGEAAAIFGTLTAAAYTIDKALDATVGVFKDYAASVRDIMNVTGLHADEASRLLQVTEDLGVSTDTLKKSMLALSKNGIDPSIGSLASLSDAYLKLAPGTERVKFLTDNFGKSGADLARVLEQGGKRLLQMNDAVSENLVLMDAEVAAAEANTLAIENLKEKWDELAITIGAKAAPALTLSVEMLTDFIVASAEADGKLFALGHAFMTFGEMRVEAARVRLFEARDALEQVKDGASDTKPAIEGLADATDDLSRANAALAAGLKGEYASAYEEYEETVMSAQQNIITAQTGLDGLGTRTEKNAEQWDAYESAIADANAELIKAHENISKATADIMYQSAAAGLDTRAALKLARSMGLISEADYTLMEAMEILKERRDEEATATGDAQTANDKYIQSVEELYNKIKGLPPETVIQVVTEFITTGSAPDTGGTGGDTGGTCFSGNTPVKMADNTWKAIRNVCINDEVLAYDGGKTVATRVVEVLVHQAKTRILLKIHMANRKHIEVTPEHLILVNGEWIAAGQIRVGMTLNYGGIQHPQVVRIETRTKRVPVYNLHVEHESHTYFANGFVVHNAKTGADEGYASGGVSTGPASGHWELLHGTELITTPQQFASLMQAASSGGATNISNGGATIHIDNVTVSGAASMGEFMQAIELAAGRKL